MKTVENNTIRVTLSDADYDNYRRPDRIEILPSGDERIHSSEHETRGRILSDAMRALAHRQAVSRPAQLDLEAGRQAVVDEYIYEYLEERQLYNPIDLITRIASGRRLSDGQMAEYADARACATGKMGVMSNSDLIELGKKIINSKNPDDRREWRRLALSGNSNADPDVAEKIVEAAQRIANNDRDYSSNFTFNNLSIEILAPDSMPQQIGIQSYVK